MESSWGERYFDHYVKFIHDPIEREVFRSAALPQKMQILAFDNVFAGCRVFCSIGLSHFPDAIGHLAELCVVADAGWDAIPQIMADVLFIACQHGLILEPGAAIRGLRGRAPDFCAAFEKPALYLTEPSAMGFPEAFGAVADGSGAGHVFLGIFISEAEYAFWQAEGEEAFERLLAEAEADPFDLRRPSVR